MVRVAATALMPDFTGRSLERGRFNLVRTLGAGAYGKVYRALDKTRSLKDPFVAVKCLNKPQPGSRTDILQQREFSLHKLVSDHPNIITFHEYFTDPLYVYVVLDLCDGGDLFSAITEKRIFYKNSPLIKNAFIQLIDAVQWCHDLGVFHRDIKPENILCSDDGKYIRLADFGLSIKSTVCHDFGCGSSYYMSPECIGREVNSRTYSTRHNDIWALGVILTNMITGRNPWRYATSEDDCFSAYLHDHNFLLRVLPISKGVNTILKRIFTVNPLRRITLLDLRLHLSALTIFYTDEEKNQTLPFRVDALDRHQPRAARRVQSHGPPPQPPGSEQDAVPSAPDDKSSAVEPRLGEDLKVVHCQGAPVKEFNSHATPHSSLGTSEDNNNGPTTHPERPRDNSVMVVPTASDDEISSTFELKSGNNPKVAHQRRLCPSSHSPSNGSSKISKGDSQGSIPGNRIRDTAFMINPSAPDDLSSAVELRLGNNLKVLPQHRHLANRFGVSSHGPSNGSSSVSEGDSKGPITPANATRDTSLTIPDIGVDENLVDAAPFVEVPLVPIKLEAAPLSIKPKRSRAQLIRAAVQRLRGLSPGSSASS